MPDSRNAFHASTRHAVLASLLIPGLGHALQRRPLRAACLFTITTLLAGTAWMLGQAGGPGAGIFFGMMIVLPWWCFQAYDACLFEEEQTQPAAHGRRARLSMMRTFKAVWSRAHDIRYLGGLFLLTALTDLYIIVANPSYALTVFCAKPEGVWGLLAKAQSPTLHLLIGYGFLRLRRWSLLLYLAYAGFGLMNALANFACFGYGRVRTAFLVSLVLFTAYVAWRAPRFMPRPAAPRAF